ncbi:MAG: hypothetical protein ACLTTW_07315 [Coprobacter sp.]
MWGQIIKSAGKAAGGTMGLAAGLFGGIKAGKIRKKQNKLLDSYENDVTSTFNKEYNADYLQRSDNQAALREQKDAMKEQNRVAENTAVITGAAPETLALQKQKNIQSLGDTVSHIARNASAYKTNILNHYQQQKADIFDRRNQILNSQAQNYTNLAMNGANTFLNSFDMEGGGGISELIGKWEKMTPAIGVLQ